MSDYNNVTVLILAAGKGSRMNSSIPKAMQILGGVPMIDHLLNKAKQLNPHQIISVIGDDMPELQEHIISESDVIHQTKKLGSAHAVYTTKYAHSLKNGITLVLYADTPLVPLYSLQSLIKTINNNVCDVCVLGFEKEEENAYGKLVVDNKGYLTKIVENKDANEQEKELPLCNSGVMAIKTEIIWDLIAQIDNNNASGEYYLTDIIKVANDSGYKASFVLDEEENLQGANTKLELADLEMSFQNSKRLEFLQQGVQLVDPDTVYFSFDTKIGRDVIIYPNVHIFPKSEIKDGSTIYPFTVIEGSVIGERSKVGPYARLRPDTVLEGDNHIGNFVEIKKSSVGLGTKINHLTYIGDSIIGKKTNIGAGTITCNYNGKNKYNTVIGDDCFIGSNVSLISPIRVENGSTVGAGSVITKNVEKNTLAVTRAIQKNIPKKK